jgi:SAM-dependent methyltransferase
MNKYKAKRAYQNKSTAESYDDTRFSGFKGRRIDQLEKRSISKALRYVPILSLVIDIPCGTGRITEMLLESNYNVVGADVSREMVNVARKNLKKYENQIKLIVCDAENLPFEDNSFDCVTSIRLMGHVPPDIRVKILTEMRRVTKEWLIISYYNPYCFNGIYRHKIKSLFDKSPESWCPISISNLKIEAKLGHLHIIRTFHILKYISETYIVLLKK